MGRLKLNISTLWRSPNIAIILVFMSLYAHAAWRQDAGIVVDNTKIDNGMITITSTDGSLSISGNGNGTIRFLSPIVASGGTFSGPTINFGNYGGGAFSGPTLTSAVGQGGVYTSPTLSSAVGQGGVYTSPTLAGGSLNGSTITSGIYSGGVATGITITTGIYSGGSFTGPTITNGIYTAGVATGTTITAGKYNGGSLGSPTITGSAVVSSATPSRLLILDSNGVITTSSTSDVQGSYLNTATSDIQTQLNAITSVAAPDYADQISNLGITISQSGNAMIVGFVTKAGATPSNTSPIQIGFRSATLGNGLYSIGQLTIASSITVTSGATLGFTNSQAPARMYIYAILNGTAITPGVSSTFYDSITVFTPTGIDNTADNNNVMYSQTNFTNVPQRHVATAFWTTAPSTAGNWATLPNMIQPVGLQMLPGTTTNDVPFAGYPGEYISNSNTGGVTFAATGAIGTDAGAISLTPGDWDVSAVYMVDLNGATLSATVPPDCWVGTATGNSSTGRVLADNFAQLTASPVASAFPTMVVPVWRQSISATTIYYTKCRATYTVGTPKYAWRLSARRVR